MGFNTQERSKKVEAVLQNKSEKYVRGRSIHTGTYICYSRYIEYGLRRRALNSDGTAQSWRNKYLFNAEWESCPRIPFSVQNIILEVVVEF